MNGRSFRRRFIKLLNRSSDVCRLCKSHEVESQEHIINCVKIREDGELLDIKSIQEEVPVNCDKVREIVRRVHLF